MIKHSIYSLFLLLTVFYAGNVVAQTIDVDKATVNDVEWSEGTITLTEGTVISGLLKLNTKTGLLGYENGSTSRSFTPRNILAFNYFDAVENRKRNFLSIAYKNLKPKDDGALAVMKKDRQKSTAEMAVPQFFEVLVECKTFALISTIGRLNIKQTTGGYFANPPVGTHAPASTSYVSPSTTYVNPSTTYSHTETLLILSEDGTIEIVLDITNTETDRQIFDTKRTKGKIDESAIEKYTTPHYAELEAYAKERKLKFKDRDDLIQIFEYYKTISAE